TRYLCAGAHAFSFGAETLRDQPDLVGTPDISGALGDALYRFREGHGLRRFPFQVLYSASGQVDLQAPIFNTPELDVILVTTAAGERRLRSGGDQPKTLRVLVAGQERVDALG